MANAAVAKRTPKQVEQYGAEAVPTQEKRDKWYHLTQIVFASKLSPAFYILAGMAVTQFGLSFWDAVLTTVGAGVLSMLLVAGASTMGPDYGLPGQVGARATFGLLGARVIVSSFRAITSVYWFAFQVLGAAYGVQAILKGWLGWEVNVLLLSSAQAILQITLGIVGLHALRSVGRLVWPLAVALCGLVLLLFLTSENPNNSFAAVVLAPAKQPGWIPILMWASVIFGITVPWCVSAADMCRYARSRRDAWSGFVLGGAVGLFISSFVGAYATIVTGDWNPFSAATQVTANTFALAALILALLVNVLTINVLNIYTAGMSLVNIFPRMGRFWSTCAMGLAALIISLLPTVVNDAGMWVREIGSVFGPLAGVFLADYLIVRRGRIDVSALFDPAGKYRYYRGVNLLAVAALVGGYIAFRSLPPWAMPAISGFATSAVLYVIGARLLDASPSREAAT